MPQERPKKWQKGKKKPKNKQTKKTTKKPYLFLFIKTQQHNRSAEMRTKGKETRLQNIKSQWLNYRIIKTWEKKMVLTGKREI